MLVTQWVLSKYLLKDRRKEAAWWERTAAREGSECVTGTGMKRTWSTRCVGWRRVQIPAVDLSGLGPGPAASLVSCVTLGELLTFSVLRSPYF